MTPQTVTPQTVTGRANGCAACRRIGRRGLNMVQTPSDMGSDAGISSGSGRRAAATIVMDPPLSEGLRKSADAVPPSQLRETIAVPRPDAEGAPEREEPSIEEYMAALLERTRQFSTSPVRDTPAAARPAVERVSRTPAPAAASPAPSPPPPPVTGAPLGVPECRDAISELRELANISTRSSFSAQRAQYLVREMRGKRTVACVAMVVSVTLLSLSSSVASPTYITAVAAVTTACAYGLKYLALGRELAWLCAESERYERSDG